jgi:hypothetical protein
MRDSSRRREFLALARVQAAVLALLASRLVLQEWQQSFADCLLFRNEDEA